MDKVTPNCYIQFKKKICNPKMITTINRLSVEWGLSQQEVCYRLLNDATMKEANKKDTTHFGNFGNG